MAGIYMTFFEMRRRGWDVLREVSRMPREIRGMLDDLDDAAEAITVEDVEPNSRFPGDKGIRAGDDPTAPFTGRIASAKAALNNALTEVTALVELAKEVRKTPPPDGPHFPEEWPRA